MYRFGPIQKKVMLTLLGGIALGTSRSSRQYYNKLRLIHKDWRKMNQRNFNRSIRKLAKERLVEERVLPNGSFKLVLTVNGKKEASRLNLIGGSIKFKKRKKWDEKWRIVIFDIPEEDKKFRDILRNHLQELKFYKLQHSVFVSPYPFEKPVSELIRVYSAEKYVRIITASKIDNEVSLKKHFFKAKK